MEGIPYSEIYAYFYQTTRRHFNKFIRIRQMRSVSKFRFQTRDYPCVYRFDLRNFRPLMFTFPYYVQNFVKLMLFYRTAIEYEINGMQNDEAAQ
jgi:hypothetical protein